MRIINKSEIKVHIFSRSGAVTGPSKVCKELIDFGAKHSSRDIDGVRTGCWLFPLNLAPAICEWYDNLPDEIHVAYYRDKVKLSRLEPKDTPKEIVTRERPTGIMAKVGDIFITNGQRRKEPRAFQVVDKIDGEAVVREVIIVDGKPVKGEWKVKEYRITTTKKEVDGRPVKVYKP